MGWSVIFIIQFSISDLFMIEMCLMRGIAYSVISAFICSVAVLWIVIQKQLLLSSTLWKSHIHNGISALGEGLRVQL